MADLVLEREVMTLFEQLLEVPEAQRSTWIEARDARAAGATRTFGCA
jgi:hypothetical protein